MTKYISLLKKSSLKATIQRAKILKSIDKAGHINIDGIYQDIKKSYPKLSLATIYKNIILMVEEQLIVEVPISGERPKYELSRGEHIHLICKSCKEIEDIELTIERKRLLKIEEFDIEEAQINLYGVCKRCQSQR
jgi:Fur family ferric uptake transcriptional regulator/Fur family peroxide stress response transcriptional regulator